jgi:hypothetical protein
MVVEPVARAVTTPVDETVALVVSLLIHVTRRSVSALPAESLGVAVNCRVEPISTEASVEESVTLATRATGGAVTSVPL